MKATFIGSMTWGMALLASLAHGQGAPTLSENAITTTANLAPEMAASAPQEVVWAVKTNALYLIVPLIANIGVEARVNNRFSIDLPFLYSPYSYSPVWKCRVAFVQPEFRWWINRQYRHFVGLHTHAGYYNATAIYNTEDRNQSKDGFETLTWGFGMSYGYALELDSHWAVEFTAGAGYARLKHDVFYNIHNGGKTGGDAHHYWGITRLGVTFAYRFAQHQTN